MTTMISNQERVWQSRAKNGTVQLSISLRPSYFAALQFMATATRSNATRGQAHGDPSWRSLVRRVAQVGPEDFGALAALIPLAKVVDDKAIVRTILRDFESQKVGYTVNTSFKMRVDLAVNLLRMAEACQAVAQRGAYAGQPSYRTMIRYLACIPLSNWPELEILLDKWGE